MHFNIHVCEASEHGYIAYMHKYNTYADQTVAYSTTITCLA